MKCKSIGGLSAKTVNFFQDDTPYKGSMELGNPQSFNRFSYVENEPTNFVDPSGLITLVCTYYGRLDNGFQLYICDELTRAGGSRGGGPGLNNGRGGTPRRANDDETFDDCVEKKAREKLKDFEEDLSLLVGETVVTVGFSILTAVLIAALVEPTPVGEIVVAGVAVGAAALAFNALISAIFAHKGLRNSLARNIREVLDACKGKPGAPAVLPTVDDVLKRIENS